MDEREPNLLWGVITGSLFGLVASYIIPSVAGAPKAGEKHRLVFVGAGAAAGVAKELLKNQQTRYGSTV